MRLLFRMVQAVDGFERTEFNAIGWPARRDAVERPVGGDRA
jgi:hypothetical protein